MRTLGAIGRRSHCVTVNFCADTFKSMLDSFKFGLFKLLSCQHLPCLHGGPFLKCRSTQSVGEAVGAKVSRDWIAGVETTIDNQWTCELWSRSSYGCGDLLITLFTQGLSSFMNQIVAMELLCAPKRAIA